MADQKKPYKFPSRIKLKEHWEGDFFDETTWAALYEKANDINADDWEISQPILNRFIEKYEVPEIIRTTGTNLNFDNYFGKVAVETHNKQLSLEEFKTACLKTMIRLNLAMEAILRSLKK